MNDDALLAAFEVSTRIVQSWLVLHRIEGLSRKRAVADVAKALLEKPGADPETIALPILREHGKQAVARLREYAARTVRP